jgi:two-component system sensor histidine kinase QseC
MISLRHRLLITLIAAFAAVWVASGAWFFVTAREQVREVLDARLSDAAEMVQSLLIVQQGEAAALLEGNLQLTLTDGRGEAGERRLSAQVWNRHNELVAATADAPRIPLSAAESGFGIRRVNGTLWRVYALTDYRVGMRVVVGERLSLRRDVMAAIALGLSAPFFVLIPLSGVIIWAGVGRGLRPLNQLGADLERRHPHHLDPIEADDVPMEAAPLIGSINRLLTRLNHAFERERRFTSDASHELRTPLAALKAQVQVARAATQAERRDRALQQIEAAANRARDMLEQLLALARMEQGALERLGPSRGDALAAARSVIDDLSSASAMAGVSVSLNAQTSSAIVAVPEAGLGIALHNLLGNALRHSPRGSTVEVRVEGRAREVLIRVIDQGNGVSEHELRRLGERFFRGEGRRGEGTGLGLSIVSALAFRYGGNLELANREGEGGFTASLMLPRAPALPGTFASDSQFEAGNQE